MKIEPFCTEDIAPFLKLAAAEGWVAEPWEFEFLLSEFSGGCFTARAENGEAAGFVTSLRHQLSGWIGNLIVSPEYRGRGAGEALFRKALETMLDCEVETVWLTASKSGMPLYQKFGFTRIDTIIRWSGCGRQRYADHNPETDSRVVTSSVSGMDNLVWDDRRDALLAATVGRGKLLVEETGFLVIQPCGGAMQFGPFSALDSNTAGHLLDAALRTVQPATKVYLDAPASNRTALLLFYLNRMRISGRNELMYAGKKPDYRPEHLFGMATMGSCG